MTNKQPLPVGVINAIGGRFSGKTTNYAMRFWIIAAYVLQDYDVILGATYNRASVQGMNESWTDFISEIQLMGIPYKSSEKQKTVMIGKSIIRFYGVNSLRKNDKGTKAGSFRFTCDYLFKIYDETFEFTQTQYNALEEATRHKGSHQPFYLTINCCNPWIRTNWFIRQNTKAFHFSEHILKNVGQQIGTSTFVKDGVVVKTLHHYTNWRVAKDVLSQGQIASVLKHWEQGNIQRARVADYGLPGLEEGGIYIEELHKVGTPFYIQSNHWVLAGMDYGWSQRDVGGKTVCHFLTASLKDGINVHAEFVHDNAERTITHNILADNIVEFYAKQAHKWMENVGYYFYPNIKVRVDNANLAMVQLLNNVAQQKRYAKWLSFEPCVKYPTPDRIACTLSFMSHQMLRIDPSCRVLLGEMEEAHYEETVEQKRAKENDHALNAFEYAIEPIMYQLANEMGLDKKVLRRKHVY